MKKNAFIILACSILLLESAFGSVASAKSSVLVFGVPNEFETFAPPNVVFAQAIFMLQLVYSPLLRMDEEQNLVPVLAKSWKIDRAAQKITFDLNTNFVFSDGTSVTPKDVIASINELCQSKLSSNDLAGLKDCTGQPTAHPAVQLKGSEITFEITTNPSIFLYQLASSRVVVFKRKDGSFIGSGPYFLSSFSNHQVKLRRNSYYLSPEKVANDGYDLDFIPERSFESSLRSLKPHGTLMFRASVVGNLQLPNYRTVVDRATITEILVLNNQNKLLSHKDVRQNLAATIYNSHISECSPGSMRAFGIIPIGLGGSIGHLAPDQLQAPKVKHHVHGVVTLHQSAERKNECVEARLKEAFKKVGIELKMQYHETYKTLAPIYGDHVSDGFVELFAFKNREAFSIFRFFNSSTPTNYANLKPSVLDEYVKEIYSAETKSARNVFYQKASQQLQDEAIVIPLYYLGQSNYIHNCVKGLGDRFYVNPFQNLVELSLEDGCDH